MRKVLITGTMTANASTLFSNITDYEPLVKQALLDNGWNIVSVKLVGSWTSYVVQVAIEANVYENFSLDQVRQGAANVLSNIFYKNSWVFDGSYPIFTNVYLNASEAGQAQIDQVFNQNNSISDVANNAGNQIANITKAATDSYIPQLILIGAIIYLLNE